MHLLVNLVSSGLQYSRQTSSSTQSVDLVGSWDNFTKHYPMERDARRAHGQWRGCHTFEDIISDTEGGGSKAKRKGGLKMGQTYYYYVCALELETEIDKLTIIQVRAGGRH